MMTENVEDLSRAAKALDAAADDLRAPPLGWLRFGRIRTLRMSAEGVRAEIARLRADEERERG